MENQRESRETSIESQALSCATRLATSVGKFQLQMQNSNLASGKRIKSVEADFSTSVDRESQLRLIEGIQNAFPTHSVLAEEPEHRGENSEGDFRWVIDPLDGTTNYFQRQDRFSISLALQEKTGSEFKTTVGVIHEPSKNRSFHAIQGSGAFLDDTPIKVSSRTELSHCIGHTNFPYDRSDPSTNNTSQVSGIIHHISNLRITGSAALDLASVACGQADFYWEMFIHLWDIAAGCLLVEQAGGVTKVLPLPKYESALLVIAACNQSVLHEVEKKLLS